MLWALLTVFVFLQARNWCSRRQTDMLLLHHQGVCSDGQTLLTLAFSVTHPSYPPQSGFERSTVRASGWLFKPIHGGTATHCTYILCPGEMKTFPNWYGTELCKGLLLVSIQQRRLGSPSIPSLTLVFHRFSSRCFLQG